MRIGRIYTEKYLHKSVKSVQSAKLQLFSMYTKEFFNQRSFEVVWAVFRVAEFSAREKMRETLEDKALNYLSKKDIMSLAELEDVVQLAMNTKDIGQVNGKVILREVENLRAAIFDLSARTEREAPARKPEKAPNVEEVFSKPPMLASDFVKIVEEVTVQNNPATLQKESGNHVFNNNKENSDVIAHRQNNPAMSYHKSGNILEDKQSAIMNALNERVFCRFKELAALFPETSQRTLRYNVQKLVDKKMIERVGNGPGSFLKLKKGQHKHGTTRT